MQNRAFLTSLKVLLAVPCFGLLVWMERQGTLPWLTNRMGWPAIYVDSGLDTQVALNLALLTAPVGFWIFASKKNLTLLARLFGFAIFGFLIFSLWQPSGIIVWSWINHPIFAQFTSFLAFWGFGYSGFLVSRNRETAAYRKNRDLVFYALALVVTPWLSLDRCLMISAFVAIAAFEIRKRKTVLPRQV